MKFLKLYASKNDAIGTRAVTPYVGTVTGDGRVVYASNSVYGNIIKLVEDVENDYFKVEAYDKFNGHNAIDLGMTLDNGNHILWATSNLGAATQDEYGQYFAWGETEGYYSNEVSGKFSQSWYLSRPSASIVGDITPDSGYDAVRTIMGGEWRMPTKIEFDKLIAIGTTWTTENSVNGRKIVNPSDSSKYLFLPAAGWAYNGTMYYQKSYGDYWTSEYSRGTSSFFMIFTSSDIYTNYNGKYSGCCIRGVIELTEEEYQDWLSKQ